MPWCLCAIIMEKFFNTAGPIKPELHYYIPSSQRIDFEEIWHLMDSQKYFLLHAPRQTGKTSALLEMMEALNSEGRYIALYINIEGAQAARNDIEAGISTVCSVQASGADVYSNDDRLREWLSEKSSSFSAQDRFRNMLEYYSRINHKPIVLFIDEADTLIGDTLVSLLRQICAGYAQRPASFPSIHRSVWGSGYQRLPHSFVQRGNHYRRQRIQYQGRIV